MHTPGGAIRRVIGLSGLSLLVGCTSSAYPLPEEPPRTWAHASVALGEPAWTVVVFLKVAPGDRIELLAAEPVGIGDGAATAFFLSPPIARPGGESVVGEAREPLAGAVLEVPADTSPTAVEQTTFAILAEIIPSRPGRYVLESVRLRYRVNDGDERVAEGIDTVLVVCADDPRPAECEDLESG
jgi:hypothetical protein